ncbi:MAG: T9SS type A sorting domain-containing protein, partial [Flavobacteriales bacterium]
LPGNICSGVAGCTAMEACNYNPDATIEDFSCVFPGEPCDDLSATTINDVYGADCVCAGMLIGCMEPTACNYNPAALLDDGSCGFPGDACEDGDPNTMGEVYGSDCTCGGGLIAGCMDMMACNYNAEAVTDDGSCLFIGATCDDGLATTDNDVVDANCECNGTVGVVELDQLFAVYPNPTEGMVVISNNLGDAIQTITLFETSGRLIGTYSVNASQFIFDMTSLNDGIYLATIQTKTHARMVRLEKR